MSMAEKARILAKLAELKSAKGPDDIIRWFESNSDFIYPMIDQMLKGIVAKYGIISCEKVVEIDAVTFILTTQDSEIIYHGIKNMIADNSGMVKKLKANFSVDLISDNVINIKVYIIPGRTDSFVRLIDVIENGLSDFKGDQP